MAHPIEHAKSSARRFGGKPEDYLALHDWFDDSKIYVADLWHRALSHHVEGIFLAQRIFGQTILNSEGRPIPVRYLGEQHVKEDLGHIPSFQDWIGDLPIRPWMYGQKLSKTSEL